MEGGFPGLPWGRNFYPQTHTHGDPYGNPHTHGELGIILDESGIKHACV